MQVRSFFENLTFSTAKLSATTTSGSTRIGTSFIYTLHDGERLYPFAVTNWHVVKGTERFSLTFPAGRGTAGALGGGMVAEFLSSERDWIRHPDPSVDLACIPIAQAVEDSKATGRELFFRSLDPGMLMRQVHYSVIDAIEDVVVVGYPNGLIDPVHLLPIVRKGITATPLEVDYGGKPEVSSRRLNLSWLKWQSRFSRQDLPNLYARGRYCRVDWNSVFGRCGFGNLHAQRRRNRDSDRYPGSVRSDRSVQANDRHWRRHKRLLRSGDDCAGTKRQRVYNCRNLTNRWTSRLGSCLFRPNFVLIVGVRLVDAAALVNSMLCCPNFVTYEWP